MLNKLDEIEKMEFAGETYYSVTDAEKLLGINLDGADYIEIAIVINGQTKKTRFTKRETFDRFKDERQLSDFNNLLKRAANFNPNAEKKEAVNKKKK